MIEQIKIDEIVRTNTINLKRIILFSSYTLETANDESHLDLMAVVEETEIPPHKRGRTISKQLWGIRDIPKDLVVYTEKELEERKDIKASFVSNVLEYGKVLHDN